MPNFWNLPIKFNNFLWVCWFLGKNLSKFVPPTWKLCNPYCHTCWFLRWFQWFCGCHAQLWFWWFRWGLWFRRCYRFCANCWFTIYGFFRWWILFSIFGVIYAVATRTATSKRMCWRLHLKILDFKCLVLLQVPKCFGLVQIFCAKPKIYVHIVAVTNILYQRKRSFVFSKIGFCASTKVFEEALKVS